MHRNYSQIVTVVVALLCLQCLTASGQQVNSAVNHEAAKAQAGLDSQVAASFARMPLSFEANQGQADARVKFLSHGQKYTLFLTSDEAVLALRGAADQDKQESGSTLHMKLAGADAAAQVSGADELPGKSNYLIGKDRAQWRTDVPTYGKVHYRGVYPGIDLVFYGNQRELEYDFVVAPGANPNLITLALHEDGSASRGKHLLRIDRNGDLVVSTQAGEMRFGKPVVYQTANAAHGQPAERQMLDGHYVLKSKGRVGFAVAKYDRARVLVIDPTLAFSTYLGGSGIDGASGARVAVDAAGNVYVAAQTNSIDFPTTSGTLQTKFGGEVSPCNQPPWFPADLCGDGFVAKFSPSGTLLYSTYIGGSGDDGVIGLTVDAAGNAYLAGFTDSVDFPVTVGAFQPAFAGEDPNQWWDLQGDGFVAVLNPDGNALTYSTYLGGTANEYARAIAVDAAGKIYVAGTTDGTDFPVTPGAFQDGSGGGGAWMAKIDPAQAGAASLIYSTYIGPVHGMFALAVDPAGNAYITGQTPGCCYPTTPGAFQTSQSGNPTGFVTALNPTGTALVYSTLLGGSAAGDSGYGIAVDAAGEAYVAGGTGSADFPVTPGAFQTTYGGNTDAFVTKLNASGTGLIYSTYLGGSGADGPGGMTIDAAGNAFIAGATFSTDFPVMNAVQATYSSGPATYPIAIGQSGNAFITELNPSGSAVVFSSYLGGTNNNGSYYVAVDSSDDIYLTGYTTATDFPVTPGAFQPNNAGSYDLFVAKIVPANNTPVGTNVSIQLTKNIGVTFSDITSSGTTAVTETAVAPPAPAGFTLGNPTEYFDVSTTASYSGTINLCFSFAGITFSSGTPQLFHYAGGSWNNVTTSVNSVNQLICGTVTSLSPFAVFGVPVTVNGFGSPLAALVTAGASVPYPSHSFKQGSTLPLSLQLSVGSTPLTDATAAAPQIVGITRNGDALDLDTVDLDTGNSDVGNAFRFTGSQWMFNLSTKSLGAGTYVITIQMPDGSLYNGGFVLR